MNILITSEVLQAYSLCPRKAFLLVSGKELGTLHEYEQILIRKQLENQAKNLELLKRKQNDVYPYSVSNLENGFKFLINANLNTNHFQAYCSILTKVNKFIYEPTIFIGTHTINHTDKLRLLFAGYVLTKIQERPPEKGYIVNMKGKSRQLNLVQSHKVLTPLLEPLQEWLNESSLEEPPVILNKHCPLCQFREKCREIAIQEDNLSLLDRVTPKIVRQYEKKGIFTVKQLSYLFKPRKRKKRARKSLSITHDIKLQALAIRTEKIYLQEIPLLIRKETELYLDIEGLTDQKFYYLIGLLVRQGDKIGYYSFWADDLEDERNVWQNFLDFTAQYPDAPIYHYGNYEVRAIKTLDKRYKTDNQSLIDRLNNVNKQIYGKVYFPVYSNKLKEVAKFVGASWTEPDASGIKSLVWRYYWNNNQEIQYKSSLITYNQEDCYALKVLVDELERITFSADTLSDVDFAQTPKSNISEVGEKISSQFEMILRFANVQYDKKKISFRQGKVIKDHNRERPSPSRFIPKPDKIVQVSQVNTCLKCGYSPLRLTETTTTRNIIDLVLTRNGIKKIVTRYIGLQGYCVKCHRKYPPPKLAEFQRGQLYGRNFKAWVIYQRVALRLPYESIVEVIKEQFEHKMAVNRVSNFIGSLAKYYAETEKAINRKLLESPFVHVDETNFNIKGFNWYVWVFTNGEYVILKLTETRETSIVHQVLEKYEGVLISDFYTGYDSFPCRQQKCWVHLIRHLNKDLRENPFDMEYEVFILEVRNLIIPIMEAIQRYGLKKYHLQKFQKAVEKFYKKSIDNRQYKSELVSRYKQHFIKYRDSLFTFLEQDGISWHNNTAENAIRHVAIQRDISRSAFHEEPTRNYLVLLGIRQTCRYQNKSFFRFLFSEEIDLDKFESRKRCRNRE